MVIRKAVSLITVLTLLLSSGLQVAAEETEPEDIDTVPAEEVIIHPEEQNDITTDQNDETENPEESELTEEAEPVSESEPGENEPVVIPEESSDGEQNEEQIPDEEPQEEITKSIEQVNVFYTAHLSNVGWTPVYTNGETSRYGRLEAFKVYTDSSPDELSLSYQVHVQNIGWMNTVGMNETAGTTGRSLQIEAIRINLSGSQAINYSVFYRTYVDGYGWTDWAVNGKTSGSEGFGKAICQTEIKILSTDDNSITPGLAPRINDAPLQYNAHVQNIGWQKYVITPAMAGTTGRSLRLESVNIRLTNGFEKKGGLQGRAHVQNLGWINSSSYPAGMTLGTVGKSLRLEAIELSLTGDLADQYDIYYRTHVQQLGWMGWAHNGESSGSSGKSLAIEAIEIRIVTKGTNVFFLDGKACFSEKLKVGFQNETINGKTVKVYYDENHNIVKKGFKL
ncbi:MAG: hypothetical protein Q4D59_10180, partial [Erysipelotrichaceae bacterium]|nr:hypothetical protein [Erysipelotrichaceae bacterium]